MLLGPPRSIGDPYMKLPQSLMAREGRVGSHGTSEHPMSSIEIEMEYELAGSYRKDVERKRELAHESIDDGNFWTNGVLRRHRPRNPKTKHGDPDVHPKGTMGSLSGSYKQIVTCRRARRNYVIKLQNWPRKGTWH